MVPAVSDDTTAFRGDAVCITGGAGFIGSHLCDALVERDADVRVIDDLSNGRPENIAHLRDRIAFHEASILDDDALDAAVAGCRFVFHQAAIGSVPRSLREPIRYHDVNSGGTLRVLEAARRHGVERVIYAASSSAYGDRTELPLREDLSPRPMSPYAAAKVAGEHMAQAYARCYGLSSVCLRYFNIFGPRQRPDSAYAAVIPRFTAMFRRGERPTVFGDGSQTRDFTYVANAVDANLRAALCTADLRGDVFNIACGVSVPLIEVVRMLAARVGVPADVDFAEPRAGEVERSWADITKARQTLGYEPRVMLEDGLARTVEAMLATG